MDGALTNSVPVFYIYFAQNAQALPASHYSWTTMRLTLSFGNRVVLLTSPAVVAPPDIARCLHRGDVDALARRSIELHHLRKSVRSNSTSTGSALSRFLGHIRNVERYFVMHEFMKEHQLQHAMMLDSDAAMTSWIGDILPWMSAQRCDSALIMSPECRPLSAYCWMAWFGTSLISSRVLADFLDFISKIFHEEVIEAISRATPMARAGAQPRWNDMMTTYAFATVADHLRWPEAGLTDYEAMYHIHLPRSRHRWHLCDLQPLGFTNNHVEFMPRGGPLHTGLPELMTPGPWSLYTRNLTFVNGGRRAGGASGPPATRLYWNGRPVRSMHFWLQKSTAFEVLPPRTHLEAGSCTLPNYHLTSLTKWWAKFAYLFGLSRRQ